MTRAAAIIAILLTGAATLSGGQQQTPPVFITSTSAVRVDVAVRDRSRKTIAGLGAADFVVLDNGVPQSVDDVSYGKLPIDVTIGLDVSLSVTGQALDQLRRAVVQLMGDLRPEDRLRLVLFSMRVNRTVDFTGNVKLVDAAMRSVAAGGGTSLLDSLSVALVSASNPDRRQLVVFFTDGNDSSSTTPPDVLETVAERTRATLTFVMPTRESNYYVPLSAKVTPDTITVNPATRSLPLVVNPLFDRLAADTGGSMIPVGAGIDVSSAFRQVLDQFRSTYVLYFSPRGVDRGGFHTLSVQVKTPGAVVQARRGYFGG